MKVQTTSTKGMIKKIFFIIMSFTRDSYLLVGEIVLPFEPVFAIHSGKRSLIIDCITIRFVVGSPYYLFFKNVFHISLRAAISIAVILLLLFVV